MWKEKVKALKAQTMPAPGTEELSREFLKAVERALEGEKKVAVLFSGGVDSTALAVACRKFAKVKLFTASAENAVDTPVARETAKKLKLEWEHVPLDAENIAEYKKQVLKLLPLGLRNDFQASLAIPIYAACKKASEEGFAVALDAAGADESFGGYHRYARLLAKNGHEALSDEFWKDLMEIEEHDVLREVAVSKPLGVEIRCPFLDHEFLKHSMAVPSSEKVLGKDDALRKRALRKMALHLGVPEEIAHRPKKAMQYGSGSEKLLKA